MLIERDHDDDSVSVLFFFLVNCEVTNPNQEERVKLLGILAWELLVLDNYAIPSVG